MLTSFTLKLKSNTVSQAALKSEVALTDALSFSGSMARLLSTWRTHAPMLARSSTMDAAVKNDTFASLLRNCMFTQMGDPAGKVVVGRIYHTVNDDLYVDFGHKFPCVCHRPRKHRGKFVRGTEVRLLVKSLELSQKFLGYTKEMTLMEADCVLLGLHEEVGEAPRQLGRRPRRQQEQYVPE